MRNVILLAGATVALTAAMAVPALANGYCHSGDPIVQNANNSLSSGTHNAEQDIYQGVDGAVGQVAHYESWDFLHWFPTKSTIQKQDASNTKSSSGGGHQTIIQGQVGYLWSECGPAQNQKAENFSKNGNGNSQKAKQFQFGIIVHGEAKGTAQDQSAKNSTDNGSSGNTQKTKQKQFLFSLFGTEGTVQSQSAQNKVNSGNDNYQSTSQSQSLFVGYADGGNHGATQEQTATNNVSGGSGNEQSIKQSESLAAKSPDGTVQSQTATNDVSGGNDNEQSITQVQHTVLLSGNSY